MKRKGSSPIVLVYEVVSDTLCCLCDGFDAAYAARDWRNENALARGKKLTEERYGIRV